MASLPRFGLILIAVLVGATRALVNCAIESPSTLAAQSQTPGEASELEETERLRSSLERLYHEGKYDEAARVAQRIVEIRSKVRPNDFKTADALNDLGELYLITNKNDAAAEAFQRALKICELNPVQNRLPISHIFERLGKIAFRKSDDTKAQLLIQRSLDLRREALNGDPVALGNSLIDLAHLFYDVGRFPKGEGIYVEALSMLEKKLGRSDAVVVEAMKNYGCTVLRAGEGIPKGPPQAEPDETTRAFRTRASCWLYGFDQNCAEEQTLTGKYESVINGKAVRLATPDYPRGIVRIIGGRVFVAVRIDENGKVINAKTVCGAPSELAEAALDAAKASRFTQTLLAGQPIQVNGTIIYTFVPSRR